MASLKDKYGEWALITGASSGIGQEFVRLLAKEGFNIILVARRENLLKSLAQEIEENFSVETRTIALDMLQPDVVLALSDNVSDLDVGLAIPAAGVDEMGRFIEKDYSSLARMLALNIEVPTEIVHAFSKRMGLRKHGGTILVSSLFGYQGIPNFTTYAASKAYILTLGEALNVELRKQGIDVLVLSPGLTDTPFAHNLGMKLSRLPMISQKPKAVAKAGLWALGHKATVVPGILNKFYAWENRLIPRSWPVKLFGFLISGAIKAYQPKSQQTITEE